MFNPTYFPRQRWSYPKEHERNYVASFFHMISLSLLSVSLVRMTWFRIYGTSHCQPYLMLNQFFGFGAFETVSHNSGHSKIPHGFGDVSPSGTYIYRTSTTVLRCVTPEVVLLLRMVILLCLAAIFCSVVGFCLDVIGPKKKLLRVIRQNGLPSIITVLLIVAAAGLSYLIATGLQVAAVRSNTQSYTEGTVQVVYEYGYYTITIAGAVSLLATACNLLQSSSPPEEIQRHRLIEEYEGIETFSVGMRNMPEPPPPYTP